MFRKMKELLSMQDQTDLFRSGEADAWYRRNKAHLRSRSHSCAIDAMIEVLGPFKSEINSILEVGCGNGIKLEQLATSFAAKGIGIEPSELAVSEGRKRLRQSGCSIELTVGVADKLPYKSAQFDLVYFGFASI